MEFKLSDQEKAAWEQLKESKSVVITSHVHPDGDAIGSCLALAKYCESRGIISTVCIDDRIPDLYRFLQRVETIRIPDKGIIAETLVIVDTDRRRIGRVAEIDVKYAVNLDHHDTNPGDCEWNIIRGRFSSTAELLYKLFKNENYNIDRQTAEYLYTGLITDTVFFKVPMESCDPFFMAGELALKGIDTSYIAEKLSQRTLDTIRLSAKAYGRLESFRNNTVVGIILGDEYDELDLTDEIVDSIRYIEGIEVAYLAKHEKAGGYRVRLRSQTRDLSGFAKQHGGGGHPDAAGYTILTESVEKAKEELVRDILKWLE